MTDTMSGSKVDDVTPTRDNRIKGVGQDEIDRTQSKLSTVSLARNKHASTGAGSQKKPSSSTKAQPSTIQFSRTTPATPAPSPATTFVSTPASAPPPPPGDEDIANMSEAAQVQHFKALYERIQVEVAVAKRNAAAEERKAAAAEANAAAEERKAAAAAAEAAAAAAEAAAAAAEAAAAAAEAAAAERMAIAAERKTAEVRAEAAAAEAELKRQHARIEWQRTAFQQLRVQLAEKDETIIQLQQAAVAAVEAQAVAEAQAAKAKAAVEAQAVAEAHAVASTLVSIMGGVQTMHAGQRGKPTEGIALGDTSTTTC